MIHTLTLLGSLFATEARADDVFDGDLVEIASPGLLLGDGGTVVVQVLALANDGEPLTGLSLRPSASEGKADGWSSVGGGWYSFRFTPPETSRPIDVVLTVKGKGPNGTIESTLNVPVAPGGTGPIEVTSTPASLVLGETETTAVRFSVDGLASASLDATVSSGSLSELKSEGGGVYTATYTAPAVNYPHLAMITVRASDHGAVVGQGVVELKGAVDFPITGTAQSNVSLIIGGTTYGPTTMDGNGRGTVPIIVSPGVNDATRVESVGGKTSREAFDLQIPPTRRLAWVPAAAVPGDGDSHVLHLAIRKPAGAADTGASPDVTASVGTVSSVRHLRDGIYSVTYVSPEQSAAGEATLEAKIGTTDQDMASLTLDLRPEIRAKGAIPNPVTTAVAGVVAVPVARQVEPGGAVQVRVAAVDRHGYPVSGVPLKLEVSGGSASGSVTTGADGTAQILVTAGDAGVLRLSAASGDLRTETSLLVAEGVTVPWPASTGVQGLWEGLGSGSGAVAVGPSPQPVQPVQPEKPTPTPKPDKPPKPPSDHVIPTVRGRASFSGGTYNYAQRPSADPGPLLPAQLVVGGPEGGRAAPLAGVDTDLRAWFVKYLGVNLGFRAMRYSIGAPSFDQAPVDWLIRFHGDVNGRIPVAIGDNQIWIGAAVGFQMDDFMVFRGCLDPGCRVEYEPLTVPALDLGGEIGAEIGPVFAIGGISQGLGYAQVPYRFEADLDLGIELGQRAFIGVGGSYIDRTIPLIAIESTVEIGQIEDRQLLGRVGIGFQL